MGVLVMKMRGAKQKTHKYEVGRNRPTETRAGNSVNGQDAEKWVAKIDEASFTEGATVEYRVRAVADILVELAEEIRASRVDIGVFRSVLRRRNVTASLALAYKKLI